MHRRQAPGSQRTCLSLLSSWDDQGGGLCPVSCLQSIFFFPLLLCLGKPPVVGRRTFPSLLQGNGQRERAAIPKQ